MSRFTAVLTALMLATLWMSDADASTVPRIDFKQGEHTVALGVLNASWDYAVVDQFSLGFSLIPMPNANAWYDPILSPQNASARASLRLGEFAGVAVGMTLSGGIFNPIVVPQCPCGLKNPFPTLPIMRWNGYRAYIQPAVNIAVPFGSWSEGWLFRATLGPVFDYSPESSNVMPLWPNVEFAYRWRNGQELTLLGNGLVGWRGIF